MIVAMHGGPHGAYGNTFAFQFQLWAARGYAVLYTNPRGSTGYGEKFLWGTWGGWGNRDFDDVMAVVDQSIKRFPIDERRMGATGYSYGGFLTNWVITHTPRFAAAIVGAGISNWISDYGTADIPRTKESEFNGPPWEPASLDLLLKQSPVIYAKNVTTPTLFIHGEADLRVPIEQGRADVRGAQEASHSGAIHSLSRHVPWRLVALEHGAPVPPGAAVVGKISGREAGIDAIASVDQAPCPDPRLQSRVPRAARLGRRWKTSGRESLVN